MVHVLVLSFLLTASRPLPQDAAAVVGAAEKRPAIVLVTIDTLRREHLGCYGYPRPTSPRVDALAAGGVLFENVLAPMATTFPSHLSMLTGLYPHQHGSTSNRGAMLSPFAPGTGRVPASEALGSIGYRTAAFVSSVVLHDRTGIGAGFETFDSPRLGTGKSTARVGIGKRTAHATMEKVLAWLAKLPAEEPFFLWVHLWDVHEPNTPTPEFAELLAPDDTLRALVAGRGLDAAELARRFTGDRRVGERFFGLPRREPEKVLPGMRTAGPPKRSPRPPSDFAIDDEALVQLHARYDACVREVDHEVGRLIDALVARGSWERTAFVFTADHGQSLGEGARLGHGANVQLNVQVPLVIHFPRGSVAQPARNARLVSLVDLMPTLVSALAIDGLGEWSAQFRGRDVLAPDFERAAVFTAEATEFHGTGSKPYECAIVSGRWKYVRAEGGPGRLHDLAAAGEAVDVSAEHADLARELERLLAAELTSSILRPIDESEPASPETEALLEQLEELGYAGDGDE